MDMPATIQDDDDEMPPTIQEDFSQKQHKINIIKTMYEKKESNNWEQSRGNLYKS